MNSTKGTSDEIDKELTIILENIGIKYSYDEAKAKLANLIDKEVNKARIETAKDILNLAHEYANKDETMVGAEYLRDYHYYNAIAKIGKFSGR